MALFAELKRRKVLRMAVLFLAAAWLILQVAGVLIDLNVAPVSIGPLTFRILAIGFPIALLLEWFFEFTRDGIKRQSEVDRVESPDRLDGRMVDFVIIAILTAALGVFAFDRWWIASDRPSLAILPCMNLGNDAAAESFVMGLHEDLLTNTAGIKGLRVISRTSVDRYRNTDKSIPQIGKELGVNHLLECGVQRVKTPTGDRVRVNAQLIQAKFDDHLWAEAYDRHLTAENLFRVQEDIARAVAGTLRVQLTEEEEARLESAPTENTAAYEAYLRGRARAFVPNVEVTRQAIADFEEAIELDPKFALAYAELAAQIAFYTFSQPLMTVMPSVEESEKKELLSRAQQAIITALDLDEGLGAAYYAMGALGDTSHAKKLAWDRALELDPNYDRTYVEYARLLWGEQRVGKAVELQQQAVSLCPGCASHYTELGLYLLDALQVSEAEAALKRAIELDPDLAKPHQYLAAIAWWARGRSDETTLHLRKAYALSPTDPTTTGLIAVVYSDLNARNEALAFLTRAEELNPDSLSGMPVGVYLNLGNSQKAREYVERWHDRDPVNIYPLGWLNFFDLEEGRIREALERTQRLWPAVTLPDLEVDETKFWGAFNYALLLRENGQNEKAEEILRKCLLLLEANPFGAEYSWAMGQFHRARTLVALGRHDEALAALESSHTDYHLPPFRREFLNSLIWDPIRDRKEFKRFIEYVDEETRKQLARVRELERNGEMPPAPGVKGWTKITAAEQHP
jgi:TolB-like protein/Tfp pilus assembly protein PilF